MLCTSYSNLLASLLFSFHLLLSSHASLPDIMSGAATEAITYNAHQDEVVQQANFDRDGSASHHSFEFVMIIQMPDGSDELVGGMTEYSRAEGSKNRSGHIRGKVVITRMSTIFSYLKLDLCLDHQKPGLNKIFKHYFNVKFDWGSIVNVAWKPVNKLKSDEKEKLFARLDKPGQDTINQGDMWIVDITYRAHAVTAEGMTGHTTFGSEQAVWTAFRDHILPPGAGKGEHRITLYILGHNPKEFLEGLGADIKAQRYQKTLRSMFMSPETKAETPFFVQWSKADSLERSPSGNFDAQLTFPTPTLYQAVNGMGLIFEHQGIAAAIESQNKTVDMRIFSNPDASNNQFLAFLNLNGQRMNLKEGARFEIEFVSAPGADDNNNNNNNDDGWGGNSAPPLDDDSAAQPFDGNSAAQPFDGNSAAQPFDDNSAAQPFDDNSAAQPFDDNSAAQPFDDNSAAQPFDDNSAAQPFDDTSAPPFDENSAAQPFDDNSAGDPTGETAVQVEPSKSFLKKKLWQGIVLPRKAFQPMTDIACSIRRPWDNDTKSYVIYEGQEFEATRPFTEFTSPEHAHDLISNEPAYKINVLIPVDTKVPRRQIKALRTLNTEYNETGFVETYDLLLGKRVCDLPKASMFRKTGMASDMLDEAVNRYLQFLEGQGQCTPEQIDAFRQMHNSTRVFMLQGAAGTGKSELIVKLVRFFTMLMPRPGLANTVLLLANSNANVDDMAERVEKNLVGFVKWIPVVLRMHSMSTEKGMLLAHKVENPDRPRLFTHNDDESIEIPELAVAMLKEIQDIHTPKHGVFDRRVKHTTLSLRALVIRTLGLSPQQHGIDPLAEDCDERTDFAGPLSHMINSIAQGAPIDSKEFTTHFNSARNFIYKRLDAVCTTLSNAADSKLYTDGTQPKGEGAVPGPGIQPVMIVIDEGERARECDVWPALVLYGRDIPILLAGDIKQLGTVVQDVQNIFGNQLRLSFMARQILLGGMSATLTRQFRYPPNVGKFMEKLFYPDELTSVAQAKKPLEDVFKAYNRKYHGNRLNMMFLNMTHDSCERIEESTSMYNFAQARAAMEEVKQLLDYKIEGKSIGIASPYEDQTALLQRMQAELAKTHPKALDVLVMNIDAFLGLERDIVILPLTIGNKLGFMKNTQRLCVALTRCRVGFLLIGNPEKMSQASNYKSTKLAQVIAEIQGSNGFVNLQENDDDNLYADLHPAVYEGRDLNFVAVAVITCFRCGELGHSVGKCPQPPKPKVDTCRNCWKEGHRASDCSEEKVFKCNFCHGLGHKESVCPDKPCKGCGKKGHTQAECGDAAPVPKRQKTY